MSVTWSLSLLLSHFREQEVCWLLTYRDEECDLKKLMNEMWVQQTHTSPDGMENECVELYIATKWKHQMFVQIFCCHFDGWWKIFWKNYFKTCLLNNRRQLERWTFLWSITSASTVFLDGCSFAEVTCELCDFNHHQHECLFGLKVLKLFKMYL